MQNYDTTTQCFCVVNIFFEKTKNMLK